MKKYASIVTILLILLSIETAKAASFPTSQFGIGDWHYRQESPCRLDCGFSCSNCSACIFCSSVMATARPAVTPTLKPQGTAKPSTTVKPGVTAKPTASPTIRPAVRPSATPSTSTGDYTTIPATAQEQKLLNLLNQDRGANGLAPLTLDPTLSSIARIKSQDMKDNHYFAHQSPTYGNVSSMLQHFGYAFRGAGENIAHHATVEKSQAAFMSSTGHRRNILGSQWTKIGIGVVYDDQGFVYVTQIFVR